jgi:hypothetical protein
MHARLSTYEGQAGELTKGFDAQTDALEQVDGFKAAYSASRTAARRFRSHSGRARTR